MNKKKLKNKKLVNLCHNHISGFLGESLYHFFLKEQLIQKQKDKYAITEKGWDELELIGLDVNTLKETLDNVTICIERDNGIFYEHIGSHLGSLLMAKMLELGWLVKIENNNMLELTEKGINGLESMGVKLKTLTMSF